MLFSVRFGMSNQIKSNQIKSYFPISLSQKRNKYANTLLEFEWVKEDLNNHQNTIHISFQFTYFSWLMCCHNFHDHWSLFHDYLDHHLKECPIHWMKWYVVWEDLKWMRNEMKMNNHQILSNTATWQSVNELPPKVTISNEGRSKTSFSFSFKSHFFLSFHSPFNDKSSA